MALFMQENAQAQSHWRMSLMTGSDLLRLQTGHLGRMWSFGWVNIEGQEGVRTAGVREGRRERGVLWHESTFSQKAWVFEHSPEWWREDQKFRVIFGYIVSLMLVWDT